jgi:lipoprotein-anchoring transpeptidase ErfK/SrfK
MPGGIDNPLGARALYIFKDGRDTIYRLHGNPDERSIGQAISSGCVRLLNQDIIDLYQRVPSGSPILVM